MTNPAESGYVLRQLFARLDRLEARLSELEGSRSVSVEVATISAVGGSTVTVTYPSGAQRPLPYLNTWSPVTGRTVLIINSPRWSGVLGPLSA